MRPWGIDPEAKIVIPLQAFLLTEIERYSEPIRRW
jgi:hypothetical protein